MKLWPIKSIGELISLKRGKKVPEVFFNPTKTGVRYLQIEDLRPEANLKYCEPFNCAKATKSDVIIAWDGANAGTVSCNLEGYIGSTLVILRPLAANTMLAPYLSRFLEGNFEYLQKTATGATIPHVSKGALFNLKIPIPPLSEQERIVKLLDEANELYKLRSQSDNRSNVLISALFYEMFGDPATNEKKWPVVQLSEVIIRITNGYVGATRDIYQDVGIPYILSRHIYNNLVHFDKETYISTEFNQRNAKSILKAGDILLVQTGQIGEAAIVPPEHEGHNCHAIIVISPILEKLVGQYLSFWFTSSSGRALTTGIQTGATLKHLNCGDVKKLCIMLPPLSLQKEFAARVYEIQQMQLVQATSGKRINDLFQSMLHRAFNGEL